MKTMHDFLKLIQKRKSTHMYMLLPCSAVFFSTQNRNVYTSTTIAEPNECHSVCGNGKKTTARCRFSYNAVHYSYSSYRKFTCVYAADRVSVDLDWMSENFVSKETSKNQQCKIECKTNNRCNNRLGNTQPNDLTNNTLNAKQFQLYIDQFIQLFSNNV